MPQTPSPPHTDVEHADSLVGVWVGERYEVKGLVASGSMGRVYRAEQHPLGREVALKILHLQGEHIQHADYADRFLREASALARLHHANTVRIFDFGLWKGRSYLVMELVHGVALADEIRGGPMEPRRALRVARQICASLHEAHDLGIVHRDLKPGNILLSDHGDDTDFVKVVDFGLVKDTTRPDDLARVGQIVGSPHYMSPEQIRGEEVDRRADIYALGVVLFKALTGRAPFPGKQSAGVLVAHLTRPAPALQEARPELRVPPALAWTIARCLEKKRSDRFTDVYQLGRALKACQLALLDSALWDVTLSMDNGRVVLPGMLTDISLSTVTAQLLLSDSLMPPAENAVDPTLTLGAGAGTLGAVASGVDRTLEEPSLSPRPTVRAMLENLVAGQLAPVVLGALLSVLVGLLAVWAFAPGLLTPGGPADRVEPAEQSP
jgi:eukaryotic-like serine/threonine-protein kinase